MRRKIAAVAASVLMTLASMIAPAIAKWSDPPSGSYQNSCTGMSVDRLIGGNGLSLEARCLNSSGRYVSASLPLPCNGDIQNHNGNLRCVAGSNPFAPPRGSYQSRCRNVQMAGPILSARCSTLLTGSRVETSINVLTCSGRDIGVNNRGRLTC